MGEPTGELSFTVKLNLLDKCYLVLVWLFMSHRSDRMAKKIGCNFLEEQPEEM